MILEDIVESTKRTLKQIKRHSIYELKEKLFG